MSTPPKDLMTLLKEGKFKEAHAMIEAEKLNSQYAPDTMDA